VDCLADRSHQGQKTIIGATGKEHFHLRMQKPLLRNLVHAHRDVSFLVRLVFTHKDIFYFQKWFLDMIH